MRRAAAAYRRLRTLVTRERLASDPTHAVSTVYQAVAPNRLHFTITNGTEAIIIGDRRWDKDLGHPWSGSPQAPIHSIIPYWVTTRRLRHRLRPDGRQIALLLRPPSPFLAPQSPSDVD